MPPQELLNQNLIPLYIGLGTVIGSIVGGFLSTLIVRSHKISTFRQEWINSVREVFSKILSQSDVYIDVAYQNNEESYKEKKTLNEYILKAKLYLNKEENQSKSLLEIVEKIPEKYFGKTNMKSSYDLEKIIIAEIMQKILKEEWNRVRDGEIIWRIKKAYRTFKKFINQGIETT